MSVSIEARLAATDFWEQDKIKSTRPVSPFAAIISAGWLCSDCLIPEKLSLWLDAVCSAKIIKTINKSWGWKLDTLRRTILISREKLPYWGLRLQIMFIYIYIVRADSYSRNIVPLLHGCSLTQSLNFKWKTCLCVIDFFHFLFFFCTSSEKCRRPLYRMEKPHKPNTQITS